MVVLRTEDGRTYVGHDAINDLIAPTRVDVVGVPVGIEALLAEPALDVGQTQTLLAHGDPSLEAQRVRDGWPEPLAQIFHPGMPPARETMLASFGRPHTNPADEIHHVVDGAVVFGLVLHDGAQVLLVIQPGDAFRIRAGTEHWSTLTADHRSKAILYLSRPSGYAHHYTGTPIRIV
jgi:hypothetical protein